MKPFKPFKRRTQIEREVEEELSFHLELLTEAHLQQDLSFEKARAAALKRFGNVERVKEQCVQISRRNRPLILAFKSFLILLFFAGVLTRTASTQINVTRLGDLLIAVPVLSWLLLYVRSWRPSTFRSQTEASSPLRLNEDGPSITAYDKRKRTPLERVLFDE